MHTLPLSAITKKKKKTVHISDNKYASHINDKKKNKKKKKKKNTAHISDKKAHCPYQG